MHLTGDLDPATFHVSQEATLCRFVYKWIIPKYLGRSIVRFLEMGFICIKVCVGGGGEGGVRFAYFISFLLNIPWK